MLSPVVWIRSLVCLCSLLTPSTRVPCPVHNARRVVLTLSCLPTSRVTRVVVLLVVVVNVVSLLCLGAIPIARLTWGRTRCSLPPRCPPSVVCLVWKLERAAFDSRCRRVAKLVPFVVILLLCMLFVRVTSSFCCAC